MALCSIGFVARHYGVSASTIRRWAAKGLLTVARRTLGGHRQRLKTSGCEEVITDIGSGLNCNKPGLRTLLNRILQGRIHTLSVVYEDRLLRFGTALIRLMCRRSGTDVRVLESKPAQTFEEELAKDVVTLMTVFCARLYGKRSHKAKQTAT